MSNLGKSILDLLWEKLDTIVDRIMDAGEPEEDHDGLASRTVVQEWAEQRGKAQGVAYAIALLSDPMQPPSVDDVRAEAMRRYDGRLLDAVVDPPPPPARSQRHLRAVRTVKRRRNQGK